MGTGLIDSEIRQLYLVLSLLHAHTHTHTNWLSGTERLLFHLHRETKKLNWKKRNKCKCWPSKTTKFKKQMCEILNFWLYYHSMLGLKNPLWQTKREREIERERERDRVCVWEREIQSRVFLFCVLFWFYWFIHCLSEKRREGIQKWETMRKCKLSIITVFLNWSNFK